jgi:hypothetical protein
MDRAWLSLFSVAYQRYPARIGWIFARQTQQHRGRDKEGGNTFLEGRTCGCRLDVEPKIYDIRQIAESRAFYKTGKKGLSFEDVFGEPIAPIFLPSETRQS